MTRLDDTRHSGEGPTRPGRTCTDRERALVARLAGLLATSAEAASRIEREAVASRVAAGRSREEAARRQREAHDEAMRENRAEHDRRIEAIGERAEADRAETMRTADAIRLEITEKGESSERKAVKQHQEAIWLAESVFEAHEHRPEEEFEAYRMRLQGAREELRGIEANASRYLRQVRQIRPRSGAAAPPEEVEVPAPADADRVVQDAVIDARAALETMGRLRLPRLFRGILPLIPIVCIPLVPGVIVSWLRGWALDAPVWLAGGAALATAIVLGVIAYVFSGRRVRRLDGRILRARARAEAATGVALEEAAERRASAERELKEALDRDLRTAHEKNEHVTTKIDLRRDRYFREIEAQRERQLARIEQIRASALAREQERFESAQAELVDADARSRDSASLSAAAEDAEREAAYQEAWSDLIATWRSGMDAVADELGDIASASAALFPPWDDPAWDGWEPPRAFARSIRFGELEVDMDRLPGGVPDDERLPVPGGTVFALPGMIELPDRCSLLIETGPDGRDEALRTLQTVMFRLLTTLPPAKVRFTIADPVGLGQNFAGFMHLADYDGALVADRIWTDARHIEQRLADLTDHMENVIQKYLRNEFETIDEYNERAGEIAEPYRFLVIADFPVNFSETAARRLASIANSGARCGVYTLIVADPSAKMPPGITLAELERSSTTLVHDGGRFRWDDDELRSLPLRLDAPPSEAFITRTLHAVGAAARDSSRVEVPFEVVAPAEGRVWTASCAESLSVPLGRCGATKLQRLTLGVGTAQHALIAGKTGSGKSTLLHVIITNLALWYGPDEVELYLVDFKKGVEFKTYASDELPHVRVVGIETDREFGLSVLQRIDAEMKRRGELFRELEVQDIAGYRRQSGSPMPRTLLIVDEFQELFVEDDAVAQDSALLLDRLVRQGRAFGVHVILGSQTLGGAYSLARSTIGQMAVRIALQCNESDSYLILSEDNSAARLLARPGEAIYNDAGGLIEGNSPFQIVWMSEESRARQLERVRDAAARADGPPRPRQIVFEGNVPGDIERNFELAELRRRESWPPRAVVSEAWFGEAIAIKAPTSATFRRQSGSNLLIVGQGDETALSVMASALISLAAQHAPADCAINLFDGTPADSPYAGVLESIAARLPHDVAVVEWRDVAGVVARVHAELERRQNANETDGPPVFLLVHGLQRYRMLRRADDFSFSMDDEDGSGRPEKHFAEIVGDGPGVGIHTIAWCDTYAHAGRSLDRQGIAEFVMRVLFQMGGADSTSLIDTPVASKLGMRRALLYHEEQGTLEKFRPYAMPDTAWVTSFAEELRERASLTRTRTPRPESG